MTSGVGPSFAGVYLALDRHPLPAELMDGF
jgi:hypothetical protein